MRISAALRRASITNGQQLAQALEQAIRKYFPRSALDLRVEQNNFDPRRSSDVWLTFAVAGSKAEAPGGYYENDLSYTKAVIHGLDADGNIAGPLSFEPRQGGSIATTPAWIKVGLKKKTGTPEQIVRHVEQYFAKLLATIKANADKIPERTKALLKSIQL